MVNRPADKKADFCVAFDYMALDVPLEVTNAGNAAHAKSFATSTGAKDQLVCASEVDANVANVNAMYFQFKLPASAEIGRHLIENLRIKN